jgi:hypothetical protein
MKAWLVRFVSLYVFDVIVLLLIGGFTPSVRVGWNAFWAALLLTVATIWLKPLIHKLFQSLASKSQARRTKIGEKVVQYLLVLAIAAIFWILLVLFTGVHVGGIFFLWGWVAPPVALTIAWAIYDLIDDSVEARVGGLFGRTPADREGPASAAPPIPPAPSASAGAGQPPRPTRDDGLTAEQRRMLDEL